MTSETLTTFGEARTSERTCQHCGQVIHKPRNLWVNENDSSVCADAPDESGLMHMPIERY